MARAFDGTDDVLSQGAAMSNFLTTTAGTGACWYRPAGTPTSNGTVYQNDRIWGDSGANLGLHRGDTGSGDQVHAYNWDGNADKVSAACTVGTWSHWVWRHAGGEIALFKDGELVGATASGNTSLGNTLEIGRNGTLFLEGDLAELAFWSIDLSNAEILGIARGWSAQRIRRASLTGYWPIWGVHSPEIDLSPGNNRTLTVSGTTKTDHPRVFRIPSPRVGMAAVAAAAAAHHRMALLGVGR